MVVQFNSPFCAGLLQETVRSLKERACKKFKRDISKINMCDFLNCHEKITLEHRMQLTLFDACLFELITILLDHQVRTNV